MTEREFPDVYQALLSPSKVHELIDDVRTYGEGAEIRLKTAEDLGAAAVDDLVSIEAALACGTRVQVRYRFHGNEWWDTLIPEENGIRLVRIRR